MTLEMCMCTSIETYDDIYYLDTKSLNTVVVVVVMMMESIVRLVGSFSLSLSLFFFNEYLTSIGMNRREFHRNLHSIS